MFLQPLNREPLNLSSFFKINIKFFFQTSDNLHWSLRKGLKEDPRKQVCSLNKTW
jgi:hypothetical protein